MTEVLVLYFPTSLVLEDYLQKHTTIKTYVDQGDNKIARDVVAIDLEAIREMGGEFASIEMETLIASGLLILKKPCILVSSAGVDRIRPSE